MRRPATVLGIAVVVGTLVFAAGSLGAGRSGPPRFGILINKEVFSTRALIDEELVSEELVTKWTASYSENAGGPWTPVNGGEVEALKSGTGQQVEIGAFDKGLSDEEEAFFLRGLKADTPYYARFTAENPDGKAEEKVVEFKTLPVEKPEIDKEYSPGGPAECCNGGINTTFKTVAVAAPDSSAAFVAKIDANGADATYHFEYAESEGGPWHAFTSGSTGTIGKGEEYRWLQAGLSGLKPERKYYARLRVSNSVPGETVQNEFARGGAASNVVSNFFVTGSAKPSVFGLTANNIRNVTADSAFVPVGQILPRGSATSWVLESASSEGGPWSVVPGSAGSVSQSVAEATPYRDTVLPLGVRLTGLKASSPYFVRVSATNSCAEGCGTVTSAPAGFTTEGAPLASVYGAHGVVGGSLRLLGTVNPNSTPSSSEQSVALEGATGGSFTLTIDGHETKAIPFDASIIEVDAVLAEFDPWAAVEGLNGGPYIVTFVGEEVGKAEPLIVANGSGLAPAGAKVSVSSTVTGGVSYGAGYRFQYVSEKSFLEHGWSEAQEGPELNAGSGGPRDVGYSLPSSLVPGESYRYRLLVQSEAPGTGVVESAEQSLNVPVVPSFPAGGACLNEAFRTGESARLQDCRAYEQLTPVEKEGAQEPFHYGGGNIENYLLASEDGSRALLSAVGTEYFTGPDGGLGPYLFTREEGQDWSILTGTAQPEAGIRRYEPQVYSADLAQVALESGYETSEASATGASSEVEYEVGPVGGPYTPVKSIPRKYAPQAGEGAGWVAGDPSLSKLVLETHDHTLLGEDTGTKSGSDLYEYTSQTGLGQLNVTGEPAVTIGECGARIAHGIEDGEAEQVGTEGVSSPHSVSVDGSRVFFEADPGSHCGGEPSHLYMRVNGSETVDIGAYAFLAADAEGTKVLLEGDSGQETVLYDTETKAVTPLPELENAHLHEDFFKGDAAVAPDLSAVYYGALGGLYRYDIEARKAERLFSMGGGNRVELTVTPDGRYVYFRGAVAGLPGGGTARVGRPYEGADANSGEEPLQVYRYDSVQHAVECISCASPYDPAPQQPAFLQSDDAKPFFNGALPLNVSVAGNGEYAFFTTPAALVKEDDDGEIGIEQALCSKTGGGLGTCEYGDIGVDTSPSSDIYEWRAAGVNGCSALAGCVALITGGHGGYKTLLLGSADEGRDVYFYTREKLVAQDDDTAGDVYDARVEGGISPPPPRPTECEANSCSIAPSSPIDLTPGSLSFTGVGNVSPPVAPASKPVVKQKQAKGKKRRKAKGRATHKKGKRARARGAARVASVAGR